MDLSLIKVQVETPNGRSPRRKMTFAADGLEYQDVGDPCSGYDRANVLNRLAAHWGVPRHRLQQVEERIMEAGENSEAASDAIEFPAYTLKQLKAMELAVRYFIENLVAQNQPLVLAGPKKALKTSLLLDLAISLAVCGKFLGYFHVLEAARVGIMTGESGLAVVLETAERIARAAGLEVENIPGLVISDKIPLLASLPHLDALGKWLTDNELTFLGIDPLYLSLDDCDPANLFAVGRVLRGVSEVCQDRGVTLVICHHTKKGVADPYAPGELEDLAWAGTAEWCRQWLFVTRRERYIPGTGDHKLWLSAGGSAGHGGYWGLDVREGTRATPGGRFWEVEILHPEDAREAAKSGQQAQKEAEREQKRKAQRDADVQRVVQTMTRFPAGETARTIREYAGLNTARFNTALAEALNRGFVAPVPVQKASRKTPFEGYKLVDTP